MFIWQKSLPQKGSRQDKRSTQSVMLLGVQHHTLHDLLEDLCTVILILAAGV